MTSLSRIIDTPSANILARSYSALLYPRKLRELLASVTKDIDFSGHDKYSLHQHINDLLTKSHQGEALIKYQIAMKYLFKDTVAGFEIKVGKSRADFATINGVSRCYEIKTELDNLKKLNKQSWDYTSVFEYNTVILDEKHLSQALIELPAIYGITIIKKKSLKVFRFAKKNLNICARCQLETLTTKEINLLFANEKLSIEEILQQHSHSAINNLFKLALKNRYRKKWEFMRKHHDQILPIDFQFFFSTQQSPSLLYQRHF